MKNVYLVSTGEGGFTSGVFT